MPYQTDSEDQANAQAALNNKPLGFTVPKAQTTGPAQVRTVDNAQPAYQGPGWGLNPTAQATPLLDNPMAGWTNYTGQTASAPVKQMGYTVPAPGFTAIPNPTVNGAVPAKFTYPQNPTTIPDTEEAQNISRVNQVLGPQGTPTTAPASTTANANTAYGVNPLGGYSSVKSSNPATGTIYSPYNQMDDWNKGQGITQTQLDAQYPNATLNRTGYRLPANADAGRVPAYMLNKDGSVDSNFRAGFYHVGGTDGTIHYLPIGMGYNGIGNAQNYYSPFYNPNKFGTWDGISPKPVYHSNYKQWYRSSGTKASTDKMQLTTGSWGF